MIDNIYSDILFVILVLLLPICWAGSISTFYVNGYMLGNISIDQIISLIIVGILTAAISSAGGLVLSSLVRKIKAKRFIKHSSGLYRVLQWLMIFLRVLWTVEGLKNIL